jgi:hypothetical protein
LCVELDEFAAVRRNQMADRSGQVPSLPILRLQILS